MIAQGKAERRPGTAITDHPPYPAGVEPKFALTDSLMFCCVVWACNRIMVGVGIPVFVVSAFQAFASFLSGHRGLTTSAEVVPAFQAFAGLRETLARWYVPRPLFRP